MFMIVTQEMRTKCYLFIDEKKIEKIKRAGFRAFNQLLISKNIWTIVFKSGAWANVSTGFYTQFGQALQGTKVTVLDFVENEITENNVKHVIELIQALENSPITNLDFCCKKLAHLALSLVQAVRFTKIALLDLTDNNIDDTHCLALGQALQGSKVTTLYLNSNLISKNAHLLAQALQNTQITHLSLDNELNIMQFFPNNNSLSKHAPLFVQALQGTCVTHLYLRGNDLREHVVTLGQALRNTSVTFLDLSDNGLGEYAPLLAQALRGTKVTTLDLSYNNIAQHAVAFAQGLAGTQVTTLNLRGNGLNEPLLLFAFAQALQGTRVTKLNLSQNNLSYQVAILAQGLQNTQVNTLNLANNYINDIDVLTLLHSLSKTKVHTLMLDNNTNISNYSWVKCLQGTQVHTLGLARTSFIYKFENLKELANALELTANSIKRVDVRSSYLVHERRGILYEYFSEEERAQDKSRQRIIQQATLGNCRRDYSQRLLLAEYRGNVLKGLYQVTFPENSRPFPPKIAHLIGEFLGYAQDENLRKRFMNGLKIKNEIQVGSKEIGVDNSLISC